MTAQNAPLGPLVCPNGHAMDDGLFHCPCCGAYRPSASDPNALIEDGRVVGIRPNAVNLERCDECGRREPRDVAEREWVLSPSGEDWVCAQCELDGKTDHW